MAGKGTGYPNWFLCPQERREQNDNHYRLVPLPLARHRIKLTGRTKPTPRNGKGHPRKSWTTREWECSCGRTGWSSHVDLEDLEGQR